jgi:GH15 family glucan-1,4-alpha-glucosidase
VVRRIADHLERVWDDRGAGVWESRGEPREYVYSKAMAWVGIETSRHREAAENGESDRGGRLERLARVIREQVLAEGWNEGLGYITEYYGGQALDASVLRLPMIGFLPATDPRMAATIQAVHDRLNDGGLIRRKAPKADGPNEGAFLACSCWMANCLDLQGKRDEAAAQLERVLAVRNDLGLLSEEYDVPGRHLTGNFPQALSHLGLVHTALALSAPGGARPG